MKKRLQKAAMPPGYTGSEFYRHARIGEGGSAINNLVGIQYHPQLGGILVGSSPQLVPLHQNSLLKRSFTESEQQQQQNPLPFRSVKQRIHQHASPISPLSPLDHLSFSSFPDISSSSCSSGRLGFPLFRRQTQNPISPNSCNSFPQYPNLVKILQSELDSDKKIRNQLQELERQLLDEDEEEERNSRAVSALTGSKWSETVKNLLNPKRLPASPASSSLSSTTRTLLSQSLSWSSSSSLKRLLMDSVTAISEGKTEAAAAILSRLERVLDPRVGNSEQRLVGYIAAALLSRLDPTARNGWCPMAELGSGEHMIATQMLYEASPCFKLGLMVANLAILDASRDQAKIHILDFDVGQGSQYMALLHELANRQSIKWTLKITALTDPNSANGCGSMQTVGERLTKLAELVGVSLRFKELCYRASQLTRESIGCDSDESLAVNFAFRLYKVADESVSPANPRDELLRVVKGLSPNVVTLVEQEMNTNTTHFVARFGEAWSYYRALIDSLDSTMTRDGSDRVRVEECLARKAANAVAKEGSERVERCEVFGKWRARMGMAGFKTVPLGPHVAESLRSWLGSNRTQSSQFFVKEEAGGICLGWMDRILAVASAWR